MNAIRPGSRSHTRGFGLSLWLAVIVVLHAALLCAADDLGQWIQSESQVARTKLLKNVVSNGAVVASPSTQNPNYFYHWVRDGAVSMNAVVDLYAQAADPADRDNYFEYLTTYVDFSRGNQTTPNPNPQAQPDRQIGEPKYMVDGSADAENWGRPQDDGPATRALALVRFANMLLDSGRPEQAAYVKSHLYDGKLPTATAIKADLEYVSHNWQKPCFDLWEETGGLHFYTRMVQRRALLAGAKLAERLNDGGAAAWYKAQAAALEPAIAQHWDAGRGYIVATLDQQRGGFKASGLDAAVVLGVLHAHAADDDFFSPTSDKVLATAQKLSAAFRGLYAVNQVQVDSAGNPLGAAIGRYQEDVYVGGNPWVLCTNALGELYYRVAADWTRKGQVALTDANIALFQSLDGAKFAGLHSGQVLTPADPAYRDVIAALVDAGDRQLRRTKYHGYANGSLSEQFDRNTGNMMSARDLTWSYASVLSAVTARSSAAPTTAAPTLNSAAPRPVNFQRPRRVIIRSRYCSRRLAGA